MIFITFKIPGFDRFLDSLPRSDQTPDQVLAIKVLGYGTFKSLIRNRTWIGLMA